MTLHNRRKRVTTKTAEEVIDQAIRENRFGELLLYGFAILFVLTGLALMIFAALKGSPLSAGLGVVSSALFLPAIRSTRRTRQESVAIRLLQAPLRQADTSKEAAEAIRIVFVETFGIRNNDRN
ncbi:MAG: hypothetical protein ACFE0I_11925 [Elainellaceae cyanobacterium]